MKTIDRLQKAFSANTREESGLGTNSVSAINDIAFVASLIEGVAWATTKQALNDRFNPEPEENT